MIIKFSYVQLRANMSEVGRLTTLAIVSKWVDYYLCTVFQQILIAMLFLGAAFYVGRLAYRSFQAKNSCQSGCGKCGALDLEKIEKKLQALPKA